MTGRGDPAFLQHCRDNVGTHFDIFHFHATPTRLPTQARLNTRLLGISLGTDEAQGCALRRCRCRRDAQAVRAAGCSGSGCKTSAAARGRQEGPAGGQEQQRWLWPHRGPSSALWLQQPRFEAESQLRFCGSRVKAGGRRCEELGHRVRSGHLKAAPHVLLPFFPILQEGTFLSHRKPTLLVQLCQLGRDWRTLKPTPHADGVGEPQGQPAESPVGPLQTPRAH